MRRPLLASAWPPRVASFGSVVVFVAVLAGTPPGFSALPVLLLTSARSGSGAAAAYAVGAAATLALATMLLLITSLALLGLVSRRPPISAPPYPKAGTVGEQEAAIPRAP